MLAVFPLQRSAAFASKPFCQTLANFKRFCQCLANSLAARGICFANAWQNGPVFAEHWQIGKNARRTVRLPSDVLVFHKFKASGAQADFDL